jgi:hypothetical protein
METNFEKIYEEAVSDLKLSTTNIRQKSLAEPGNRLKWYKIQIMFRRKIDELRKQEKDLVTSIAAKNMEKIPLAIKLTQARNAAKVESEALLNKISELEEILYFVSNVNKIYENHTFTVKNAIEAIKLENQI